MASFDIFYMTPDHFRTGILGYDFCKKFSTLPNPSALSKTHIYLQQIEAHSLDDVFRKMQGEVWSPNGEARALIESRGLAHTSMSVGDIVVNEAGECWMVDVVGFKQLELD